MLRDSMIPIKSAAEIHAMREACRVAATVLEKMCQHVEPGINTYDLDQYGRELIEQLGARSACYQHRIGSRVFPSHTCLSVNEEVIHGIGTLKRVLREGDVIAVDVVVNHEDFIGDNARSVPVGDVAPEVRHLLDTTQAALMAGISEARDGHRVGAISHTIQTYIESRGLSIVRDFVGHGVGRSMHEEPQIPNYGRRNRGERLRPGMTLAIEPMVNMGSPEIRILDDGWTAAARDNLPSAHFEHTVLVTAEEPEILTRIGA